MLAKIFLLLLLLFTYLSYAVEINTLDIDRNNTTSINTDINFIFSLFQTLNKFLWFIVAIVVMAIFAYLWISLMKSEGKEEEMKKLRNMLKWAGIGIGLILLAAAIIMAVVTLFN